MIQLGLAYFIIGTVTFLVATWFNMRYLMESQPNLYKNKSGFLGLGWGWALLFIAFALFWPVTIISLMSYGFLLLYNKKLRSKV